MIYKIIISILLLALVVLGVLFYQKINSSDKIIEETTEQKDSLSVELNELFIHYSELQTNNDSMNVKIEEQKAAIENMLNTIKRTRTINAVQIDKYKRELRTLREIMKSYIVQIDSLNTQNKILTSENIKIKSKYSKEQQKTKSLEQKTQGLENIIHQAAMMEAINIYPVGVNSKDKEQKRMSRTKKIKVCFTLNSNVTAKKGERPIYIQIISPSNKVLSKDSEKRININGETIIYSDSRKINFEGEMLDICIYYNCDKSELSKGVYQVFIYIDENKIGNATFRLK